MDREKVVREIEDAFSDNLAKAGYFYGLSLDGLKDKALTDALALLKEQDAVEPKVIRTNAFGHPVHACGKCGLLITESMNYCHECGKRIDWEGR